MFDPIFEEICRAKGPEAIQGTALKRWQAYLRETADPAMAELADRREKDAAPKAARAPKTAGATA